MTRAPHTESAAPERSFCDLCEEVVVLTEIGWRHLSPGPPARHAAYPLPSLSWGTHDPYGDAT